MSSDGSLLSADDSRARGLGAGRSHFPSMEAMDLRDSIQENEYLEWSVNRSNKIGVFVIIWKKWEEKTGTGRTP